MHKPNQQPRARGFTLLEIIIVVGMLAALAGALIVNLNRVGQSGAIKIEEQYLTTGLRAPLMAYRLHMGRFPNTSEGLAALQAAPVGAGRKWRGPYLDGELADAWGNAYQYRFPGEHEPNEPDIWSNGPNGVNEDGGGDDIVSWTE